MADSSVAQAGIYQIRNTVNGKKYIGSACNLKQRRIDHFKTLRRGTHHSRYLQASWNKYGEDSFSFEVIEHVPDKAMLIAREQHYFDLQSPAYNSCRIAGSCLGFRHSDSSKEKMSKGRKGRKLSPEHIEKIRQRNLGRSWSDSQRAKMEFAFKVRSENPAFVQRMRDQANRISKDPEIRKKVSLAMKGRPSPLRGRKRSEVAKEKSAAAHRGMKRSEETCRRISESRKGKKLLKPRSAEYRAKISAIHKGRSKSPEHAAAFQEGRRQRVITADERIKIGLAVKRQWDSGLRVRERSEETRNKLGRAFAKLSDDQVREIRRLRKEGFQCRELAEKFNSNPGTIAEIGRGRRYKWVTQIPEH